jgi:hypothetical protein
MSKLAAARVAALFLLLAGGCVSITRGAFALSEPAGFITGGVLAIAVALFVAYLSGVAAK